MCTADELSEIAYKKEKVVSRRLAKKQLIPIEAALEQVLSAAAGTRSLPELVVQRRQAKADLLAKTIENKQARAAVRAQKLAARQPDPTAWLAWFDGSSHPNPGKMGIGAILKSPQGEQTNISFHAGQGDSSAAEYIALISVLEAAISAGADKLLIYGDSQVVINDVQQICGGAAILKAYRNMAQTLLARLSQVSLRWIPREKNSLADHLSQQAIRVATSTPNPQSA